MYLSFVRRRLNVLTYAVLKNTVAFGERVSDHEIFPPAIDIERLDTLPTCPYKSREHDVHSI